MRKMAALLVSVFALVPLAGPAGAAASLPFHGTLRATETDTFQFPIIVVEGSGSGVATHLGQYSLTFGIDVNVLTASGPASATLVAANGDEIVAEGIGVASDQGGTVEIDETYTITGGSGRFDKASGEFTVHRVLNLATGVSTGWFEGSIVWR